MVQCQASQERAEHHRAAAERRRWVKAIISGKSIPPGKTLLREEWDFRARPEKAKKRGDWTVGKQFDFLPDDEVGLCWLYEFTRKGRDVDLQLKWRASADNPRDFDSLLAHYWHTDPNGKEGHAPVVDWFYTIWPDWPEKSFLSVKRTEREDRYKKIWGGNPKRQLRLVSLRDIYRFGVALKAGENPKLPVVEASSSRIEVEPDTLILRSIIPKDEDAPKEIAAFVIDYNLGDKILARRFQNWLAQRRKEKGYVRQEHRGNSGTKLNRAELCALGAWRLLDSGLSIKEAQDYTEKVSGKALFADPGDWSKAKKTAREALYRGS
jgi:hypothetical protein